MQSIGRCFYDIRTGKDGYISELDNAMVQLNGYLTLRFFDCLDNSAS